MKYSIIIAGLLLSTAAFAHGGGAGGAPAGTGSNGGPTGGSTPNDYTVWQNKLHPDRAAAAEKKACEQYKKDLVRCEHEICDAGPNPCNK